MDPGMRQGAGRLVNVTIKQVAQEARLDVAQWLRYVPNIAARSLISSRPEVASQALQSNLPSTLPTVVLNCIFEKCPFDSLNIVRVPEEIALAGFDDTSMSRFILPTLTTVRVSIPELGTRANERLIYGIHKKNKHRRRHETLPTSFVVRKSCGASLNNESNSSGIRASPSKRTKSQK
jgi:DNA-binding LacI/PurR family transcriptional regulator